MSQFARPNPPGAAPLPAGDGNMAVAVYLLDPVTGSPVTPAGEIQGGGGAVDLGASSIGSIGTSGSDVVVAGGTYKKFCIILNTHATQTLYLAFNTGVTSANTAIGPGMSIMFPAPFGNHLYGLGSGAATTCAVIGV